MHIDAEHNGPPGSAHGGVSAGTFAALVPRGPTEVRLLAPPPLATTLTSRLDDDGTTVVVGPDGDIARVRSLDAPVAVGEFALVDEADVDRAATDYLAWIDEWGHAFPTCFGCGPQRADGSGLREFPGPIGDGTTVVARFRVDGADPVPDWLAWAGLDCPSGICALRLAEPAPRAVVLGTLAGQIGGVVHAGTSYQVHARMLEVSGRKHTTEVAMLAPDGAVVAQARAVWIEIDAAAHREDATPAEGQG